MLENVKDNNGELYISPNGEGNFNLDLDSQTFGPYESRIRL